MKIRKGHPQRWRAVVEGLSEAAIYAKIDALWRRTKKKRGEDVTQYDWGYRDGLFAARGLFGKTHEPKPLRKSSSK